MNLIKAVPLKPGSVATSGSRELELARLLRRALTFPNVVPMASALKFWWKRQWIFIERETMTGRLLAMPTGLAILAARDDPETGFAAYRQAVVECGWSYELGAEKVSGISRDLLIDLNKARDRYSLEEMIVRLETGLPLLEKAFGPPIIDKISDPGT